MGLAKDIIAERQDQEQARRRNYKRTSRIKRQLSLWPRLMLTNEERRARYQELRHLGFSRADAIKNRDLGEKPFLRLVAGAIRVASISGPVSK